MPTQESINELPPVRREASLVEKVTYSGIGLLLGGLAVYGILGQVGPRAEDDERPPIIVRNGSVHVEVATPGSDGVKGKLEKVGDTKVWNHKHGAGGPKKFSVVVVGVNADVANNCSSTPAFFAQRVSTVTITYSRPTLSDRTIGIAVAGADLQVTGDPNAMVDQSADHLLDFDSTDGAALKSVTLAFRKKANDNSDTSVTCTFGGTVIPEIVVLQRK